MPFMPRTTVLTAILVIISWPAECTKAGEFCYPFRGKCHGNLGQFMRHTLLSESRTRDSEVVDFALADWDHDGDLDLVLVTLTINNSSSFSSYLRFFENTEGNLSERAGCSNPFENISINYTSDWLGRPRVLKLVDWDGDNRTDLIIASGDIYRGNLRYFQQAPDGQLLELTGVENPFHMISAVDFETADWDGDGDQDLFLRCGSGWSGRGWCYFERLQNSSLSPRTGVANPLSGLPTGQISRVQAVDWDGDGDLDILCSSYSSASPKLYSRAADMSLVDRGVLDFLKDDYSDNVVVAADFDGDGDLDVVKVEQHWSDGPVTSIEFLEQVPDPTLKRRWGPDNPFAEIKTDGEVFPEFVDWDGDGDVDLLLGTSMGGMRYFERHADGTVEEKIGILNPFHAVNVSRRAVPKAIDWDSDGHLDLVVGARDGSLHFFKQASNGSLYAITGQANPFQNITVRGLAAPEVVDWDGDGDLDLFLGSSTGVRAGYAYGCGVFYYEQFDNATFHGRCYLTLTQKNYFVRYVAPRAGDWDRDGDVDLLLVGSGKVDSRLKVWNFERLASDTVRGSWSEHPGPYAGLPGRGGRVSIADWDNDGDWDVLLGLGYFEGGWCKSPDSCQHGMCDPATGTCTCWPGYDQADCSGCGSGYFRSGKSAVYQPKDVALTRKCSPCPGILLHGTACSLRGQCRDAHHAQELALEISPASRAYNNLTAFGEGDCECSAPFHGKNCERGECGAGFEYVKSELWSCRPCPPGYFKPGAGNGDRCEQCLKGHFAEFHGSFSCDECTHFLWRVEVTQDRAGCQYSHMNAYMGLPVVLVSMLLFLPLPFACGLRMIILDVRTLGDRVQVTTNGQHYILSRAGQVRVCFRGTKIPWLDDSSKVYYARVEDYSKLSLHNKDGSKAMLPVSETSTGEMRLLWRDAFLGVGLLNIPFICWSLFFFLCILALVVLAGALQGLPQFQPTLLEVLGFAVGLFLSCCCHCWRCYSLSRTAINKDLNVFRSELNAICPHPEGCERGPGRAISLQQLWQFFNYFQQYIGTRNMYYVCSNLVCPLTQPRLLSYAELAGPSSVRWFVSHYWGGSFSQFVEALQKHSRGGACRQMSYWICTFSNNQWKIKEELGETWEHSSFYLALRSGLCMGTLMVLDEEAMPLTRSWCLFELLQTAVLSHDNADFQGLLLCTHSGVMNNGQSNMDMAMSVSEKLSTLRLQDASASVQSDKEMIDDLVRQQPGGFTAINQYLVAAVRGALTALQSRFQNDLNRLQVNLVAAEGSLRPSNAFVSGGISADGHSSVPETSHSAASVEAINRDEMRSSSLWHRAYCFIEKVLEASKISETSTDAESQA